MLVRIARIVQKTLSIRLFIAPQACYGGSIEKNSGRCKKRLTWGGVTLHLHDKLNCPQPVDFTGFSAAIYGGDVSKSGYTRHDLIGQAARERELQNLLYKFKDVIEIILSDDSAFSP